MNHIIFDQPWRELLLIVPQKALNLYNAALVTPTYYVYFTSAVIITSAVLFQGFKGTPIEITTVVLGFLQICSGVVLLQLSKSAKDVPDTAVFKGDLDQMRTVAEQEEPEYEPRADTIRGGGALLRSISRIRQSKQMQEIGRLREEHMEPIGEDEQVEFDGLRRRRTIVGHGQPPSTPGSISRRKSIHPPLGMSHFPDEEELHEDEDMHPGIFHFRRSKIGRDRASTTAGGPTGTAVPLSPLKSGSEPAIATFESKDQDSLASETYGLGLNQDTVYRGPSFTGQHSASHIQFAGQDPRSGGTNLTPPPPVPPHKDGQRRQFSFQNVFSHQRSSSGSPASTPGASARSPRPPSRSALSFGSRRSHSAKGGSRGGDGTTEEERLGLVKGDSATPFAPRGDGFTESPPSYSDDDDADALYRDDSLPSGREVEARNRERERRRALGDEGLAGRSASDVDVQRLPSAKRLDPSRYNSEDSGASPKGGRRE